MRTAAGSAELHVTDLVGVLRSGSVHAYRERIAFMLRKAAGMLRKHGLDFTCEILPYQILLVSLRPGKYGNLAQDSFGQILKSQGRRPSTQEGERRSERFVAAVFL
jgi:hypothetical protein